MNRESPSLPCQIISIGPVGRDGPRPIRQRDDGPADVRQPLRGRRAHRPHLRPRPPARPRGARLAMRVAGQVGRRGRAGRRLGLARGEQGQNSIGKVMARVFCLEKVHHEIPLINL